MLWLGMLFVLAVTFFLGYYVARQVPDEVEPARNYLALAPDVLLLIMTGLVLSAFGWGYVTVGTIALLVIVRFFIPFHRAYAPVSGAIVGVALFLSKDVFFVLLVLCLLLNYLTGALEEFDDAIRHSITQPLVATAAISLILFL